MPSLPLAGITVLDLTRVLAGPLAAQTLADLGANVIKVERPGTGDDSRSYGPPYLADGSSRDNAFYLSANRGKRSVTVDIASPRGQEIVRGLARKSDVLIENFKVGDLARYQLDYTAIRQINTGVIYCSITGFGQQGPYRKRPGYDAIFQAMSGLMSVTGLPDDEPGGGPMKVGPSIVDVLTGMNAATGILAALLHRQATGVGQQIDVALLDSAIASMSHYAQIHLVSGEVPARRGTTGNGGVPSQAFLCADGAIMLTAGNDGQYARLCSAIGRPDLATDPRFSVSSRRRENRKELSAICAEIFLTRPVKHWLDLLDQADVPHGPINDLGQVFADPQVQHRSMQVTVAHPLCANLSLVANPIRFSETPISSYQPPPMLGQHTGEVLREVLGYDEATLQLLEKDGVI